MRYPGHFELMRFFFDELGLRDRRALAGEILVNAKPPSTTTWSTCTHAVEGLAMGIGDTAAGQLTRKQYVRAYQPLEINGRSMARHLLDDGCIHCSGGRAGRVRSAAQLRVPRPGAHPVRGLAGDPQWRPFCRARRCLSTPFGGPRRDHLASSRGPDRRDQRHPCSPGRVATDHRDVRRAITDHRR